MTRVGHVVIYVSCHVSLVTHTVTTKILRSHGGIVTPEQHKQAVREARERLVGGYTEALKVCSLEPTDGVDAPFGDPQTLTARQLADAMDRAQYQAMVSVTNAETDPGAYDDACMYAAVLIEAGAIRGNHRAPKWLMDFVRGVLNGRIQRPPRKARMPDSRQELAIYLVVLGLQSRYSIPVHGETSASTDSAIMIVAEAMNETPEVINKIFMRFRGRLERESIMRREQHA